MANLGKWRDEIDWICDSAQDPASNNYNRYCDWFDWHTEQKDYEREVKRISTAKAQLGWSAGGTLKRVACMPLHIFNIMKRIDPEFATGTKDGKKKLLKFILQRPEFAVPKS